MSDTGYWIPLFAVWAALICRLPSLARCPRDPSIRAVCAVLFLNGATFLFANPSVIGWVNNATSIPNLSAPLDYGLISALSAACLILIVYWRDGQTAQARRTARRWMLVFGTVIALLVTLFTVGNAPEERRIDFDTYYARTPGVREMITLYLASSIFAAIMMAVMCWRWGMRVTHRSRLHRGLHAIALGNVIGLFFGITKGLAVGARWMGIDWDALSTLIAPPAGAVGTLIATTGFLIPLFGEHIDGIRSLGNKWSAYRQLRPLWQGIRTATPNVVAPIPLPWWAIDLRLTRRTAEIHDGRLALRPYHDNIIAELARARAEADGLPEQEVQAIGEAAMLASAIRAKTHAGDPSPALPTTVTEAAEPYPQRATLVEVSRAFRNSPIVASLVAATPAGVPRP